MRVCVCDIPFARAHNTDNFLQAAKQYAGESAATASDPAQQKENQHKRDKRDKRAKSDKKKSKQGKKRGQKVKSRVQGSWGR